MGEIFLIHQRSFGLFQIDYLAKVFHYLSEASDKLRFLQKAFQFIALKNQSEGN